MEFCGGGSLKDFAALGLREEMIRHYTRDLLKAVEKLHSQNIVHRNIKGGKIEVAFQTCLPRDSIVMLIYVYVTVLHSLK